MAIEIRNYYNEVGYSDDFKKVLYIQNSEYAYVEPVFTLPEYRKMGLGKATVLEGVKRCGKRGAKYAIDLSTQQFYYSIGFYPIQNETWWKHTKI